jgi:hypothetical protein
MEISKENIAEIRANFEALPEEEKETVREFIRTEESLVIARVLGIRPSLFLNLVKETKSPKKRQIQGLGAPV